MIKKLLVLAEAGVANAARQVAEELGLHCESMLPEVVANDRRLIAAQAQAALFLTWGNLADDLAHIRSGLITHMGPSRVLTQDLERTSRRSAVVCLRFWMDWLCKDGTLFVAGTRRIGTYLGSGDVEHYAYWFLLEIFQTEAASMQRAVQEQGRGRARWSSERESSERES